MKKSKWASLENFRRGSLAIFLITSTVSVPRCAATDIQPLVEQPADKATTPHPPDVGVSSSDTINGASKTNSSSSSTTDADEREMFRSHLYKGMQLRQKNAWNESLAELNLVNRCKYDSLVIPSLGWTSEVLAGLGRGDEAIEAVNKALSKIKPEGAYDLIRSRTFVHKGLVEVSLGRYEDAAADFTRSVDILNERLREVGEGSAPDRWRKWLLQGLKERGRCYKKLGMFKEAADDARHINKLRELSAQAKVSSEQTVPAVSATSEASAKSPLKSPEGASSGKTPDLVSSGNLSEIVSSTKPSEKSNLSKDSSVSRSSIAAVGTVKVESHSPERKRTDASTVSSAQTKREKKNSSVARGADVASASQPAGVQQVLGRPASPMVPDGLEIEEQNTIENYTKLIAMSPKDKDAYFSRGMLLLSTGKSKAAAKDFLTFLNLSNWLDRSCVYGTILCAVADLLSDDRAAATAILNECQKHTTQKVWPYQLVAYLNGKCDEAAVLSAASDIDSKTVANCYIGMKKLKTGQTAEAIKHFDWVSQHGDKCLDEYLLASHQLRSLGAKK